MSLERAEKSRYESLQSPCAHRTVREAQCEHGPKEKRRLEAPHRGGCAENKKGHVKNVVSRQDAKQRWPIDPCDFDLVRRPRQKLAEDHVALGGDETARHKLDPKARPAYHVGEGIVIA